MVVIMCIHGPFYCYYEWASEEKEELGFRCLGVSEWVSEWVSKEKQKVGNERYSDEIVGLGFLGLPYNNIGF
jgi:hypothetical protein